MIMFSDMYDGDREELENIGFEFAPEAVTEEADQGFRITNDKIADWALRKIAEERKEYERLESLGRSQISEIQARLDTEKERMENRCRFFINSLNNYFRGVPHKATKTTEKYKLLSGELVLKKGKEKPVHNDDVIKAFLAANNMPEFLKIETKVAWADLKAQLTFVDGAAILPTGEILPGVSVETTEDEFIVNTV